MADKALVVESERLRAIATLNSRSRVSLFVYLKADPDTPHLVEDVNLANSEQRQTVINQLEEAYRSEANPLLAQLAAVVAEQRTKLNSKPPSSAASSPLAPEPWPWEVNGTELLSEIVKVLKRFVVLLRPEYYDAVALWVLFAHAHDAFMFSPILIATSPEKGSGKSRLLEVLNELTPKPWLILSPSDAVIFRKVDRVHPTLLLDEGDNVNWRDRKELLSMLNGGFQRRSAIVPRCVGEGANLDTKDFSVWCPKALACLRVPFPDTTVSRSIVLPFRRKTTEERVENLRLKRATGVFGPLLSQALRWAADNLEELRGAEPKPPAGLSDRTADAWDPLLAIADLAGGDWPDRARHSALVLNGRALSDDSVGAILLADIYQLFAERATDRLPTTEILTALTSREDRPWIEWGTKKVPLTGRGLAKLLDPFEVGPRPVRDGGAPFKGYMKKDFIDAWARYLPSPSVTSVTSALDNDLQWNSSVTGEGHVTDKESPNPLPARDVTEVTDRNALGEAALSRVAAERQVAEEILDLDGVPAHVSARCNLHACWQRKVPGRECYRCPACIPRLFARRSAG
jgi:hypothetical protein